MSDIPWDMVRNRVTHFPLRDGPKANVCRIKLDGIVERIRSKNRTRFEILDSIPRIR